MPDLRDLRCITATTATAPSGGGGGAPGTFYDNCHVTLNPVSQFRLTMPTKKRSAPDSQAQSLGVSKSLRSNNTSPHGSIAADPDPPRLPSDSPTKQGSASASKNNQGYSLQKDGKSSKNRSQSKLSSSHALSITSDNAKQETILYLLKSELNGAVFHQPNFVDALLPCSDEYLEQILRRCAGFDVERNKWTQPPPTGSEDNFYRPIVDIFNAIGLAVRSTTLDPSPYAQFQDRNDRPLTSCYPGMSVYPDIIRCERPDTPDNVHWQDIDMFVEVKNKKKLMKDAIRQSARYARALFAHRIDRRFIRTLVVCGTTAVFLHFDRSGVIYSDNIDMYGDPRRFIRAFAGLLLLRGADAGYNPIFTNTWRTPNPENPKAPILAHTVTINNEKYTVVDVLCIRKSVRGRATLVLALRNVKRPPGDKTIDGVLKVTWRDQSRFREGLILREFVGTYGVCQMMYDEVVNINGNTDVVCSRSGLSPGPLGEVFGPPEENPDMKGARRDDCRVHNMLLMQPGRPLSEAKSPFELLAGFVGALMGHWAFVNKQVQHRDISANNILLTLGDYKYERLEWEQLKERGVDVLVQEFQVPEWDKIFNESGDHKYEKVKELTWKFIRRLDFLKQVIKVLGPKPFGFLSDVDMANILTLSRKDVTDMHTHRTGTLAFMSHKLLLAEQGDCVPHEYLHDLESFFWVLLYTVAEHMEGKNLAKKASDVISKLDLLDPMLLGNMKLSLLTQIADGSLDARSFNTTWSKMLAPILKEFAEWTLGVMKHKFDSTKDPDSHFEKLLTIFLDAAIKVRSESNTKETQATHICSSTDECTSCPLRDTRKEGEEPKISRSSKGSSDLP
ncbi:hypothetical protein CTheo_2591 [Ceratobasidium theobromae]|uniref:Fungal-type protein kinase domain-containing protein n=1 Tax=Ceratobasidium theobromae TaxID=1582974 RepID=A0A5N5QQG2_9AGAM|nr:hypothetical protein CTheo_2591 [Ceratobasidium theobromae]